MRRNLRPQRPFRGMLEIDLFSLSGLPVDPDFIHTLVLQPAGKYKR